MSDPSTAERLAALQASRSPRQRAGRADADRTRVLARSDPPEPAAAPRSVLAAEPGVNERPNVPSLRIEWPWSKVAATGASVVSFASMIVAMGPLLGSAEVIDLPEADQPIETPLLPVGAPEVPVAPPVVIDVKAPGATPSSQPVRTGQQTAPTTQAAAAPTSAEPTPSADSLPPSQSTPPPETQPADTQPVETQPADSQPQQTTPATNPPEPTQPTAPPTTQPPQSEAPTSTTVPPRSEGSGG